MTKDEIMSMTPQQLENEIAKLKGWTGSDLDGPVKWVWIVDEYVPCRYVWVKSMEDAWELVEEIKTTWAIFKLTGYKGGQFMFDLQDKHYTTIFWASGETAPLAICRAWMMWKLGVK